MENISNQVGGRIRQHRQHLGLTQESLALTSGVNVSFLGDVERGIKKPSIETLEKLLCAMGVTFLEFFDFETSVKPLKDFSKLEKLQFELSGRSEGEIDMVCSIIQQLLKFSDKNQSKP